MTREGFACRGQNIRHFPVKCETLAIPVLYSCTVGYGFERRCDVRVDPEGPEGVVEVEDYEGWEGETVGEY